MTGSGSGEERTWEVERDRFGVMFSGPLEVGECKQVVEASAYRAEREARERAEEALREIAAIEPKQGRLQAPAAHAMKDIARASLSALPVPRGEEQRG